MKGSHYEIQEHSFAASVCVPAYEQDVIWAFLHVDDTCGAQSVHVCISLCVVSISCVWVMYECIWLCTYVVFSFQPIIQLIFVKSPSFYLVNN